MTDSVYLGLPRKWRPVRFSEIVGQTHITRTLLNAIRQGKVAHSFLLSGPRGIGKTTTARIIARALNCLDPQDGEPCNRCSNCLQSLEGAFIDTIEIDAASNTGVDDIRLIRENVNFAPINGKVKSYIIDEVHMLSTSAFNALLKTLEEPPSHVYFFLATTAPQKVPPTILSRCLRLDFRRISVPEIRDHLVKVLRREGIEYELEALDLIARKADGSIRDALSLLDQIIAFGGDKITRSDAVEVMGETRLDLYFAALELAFSEDIRKAFTLDQELATSGIDPRDFIEGLQETITQILQIKALGDSETDLPLEAKEQFIKLAKQFDQADLLRMLNLASQAEMEIRREFNPRQKLQLLLLKYANLTRSIEIAQLLNELRESQKPSAPQTISHEELGRKTKEITPPPATSRETSHHYQKPKEVGFFPSPLPEVPINENTLESPLSTTQRRESYHPDPIELSKGNATSLEEERDIQKIWSEVCEELIKEHNSSGNLLKNETAVASFKNGILEINCASQVVLNRAKSLQTDIIRELTSRLGTIKLIFRLEKMSSSSSSKTSLLNDPKVKILMEELGAKPHKM